MTREAGLEATLAQIKEWLVSITHPEDQVDNLVAFFQRFDTKGSGRLSRSQMLHILTQMGEGLSRDEATQILESIGATAQEVDYRAVCEKILGK